MYLPSPLVLLGVICLMLSGCRHGEPGRQPEAPAPTAEVSLPPAPQPEEQIVVYEMSEDIVGEVDPKTGELLPPVQLLADPLPENIYPRCEHVMPRALRERLFPASEGWKETRLEGFEPTTCAYEIEDLSLRASFTYLCGAGMSPPAPGSYDARVPEGATVVEGLGHLAYYAPEQDGLRLDVFDRDTPCRIVVRWNGREKRWIVTLGREAMAAARRETVLRPMQVALVWAESDSAEEVGQWLPRWKEKAEAQLKPRFKLAPGFPRVVEGHDVEGLQPDRRAFVLGYCPPEQGISTFESLYQIDALRVRTRLVELSEKEQACPRRLGPEPYK